VATLDGSKELEAGSWKLCRPSEGNGKGGCLEIYERRAVLCMQPAGSNVRCASLHLAVRGVRKHGHRHESLGDSDQ
jgi:hypothetical protein